MKNIIFFFIGLVSKLPEMPSPPLKRKRGRRKFKTLQFLIFPISSFKIQ